MPEDSSPPNNQQTLEERLRLIEELLRMQTARLHAIEDWLGIDFKPPAFTRDASRTHGDAPARPAYEPPRAPAHDATVEDVSTRRPATSLEQTTPHAQTTPRVTSDAT
ncbi:MAG TPA: hypothetical protein VGV38_09115, partial [Pyrinomonadaceae bacterium]|nr:hypothetical protein [Pyrinomonadaceae bacterium]